MFYPRHPFSSTELWTKANDTDELKPGYGISSEQLEQSVSEWLNGKKAVDMIELASMWSPVKSRIGRDISL